MGFSGTFFNGVPYSASVLPTRVVFPALTACCDKIAAAAHRDSGQEEDGGEEDQQHPTGHFSHQ